MIPSESAQAVAKLVTASEEASESLDEAGSASREAGDALETTASAGVALAAGLERTTDRIGRTAEALGRFEDRVAAAAATRGGSAGGGESAGGSGGVFDRLAAVGGTMVEIAELIVLANDTAEAIGEMGENVRKARAALGALKGRLSGIVKGGLSRMVTLLPRVGRGIAALVPVSLSSSTALGVLSTAASLATGAIGALFSLIVAHPVGALLVALVALITFIDGDLLAVFKRAAQVVGFFLDALGRLPQLIGQVLNVARAGFDAGMDLVKGIWRGVKSAASMVLGGFAKLLRAYFDLYRIGFEAGIGLLEGLWAGIKSMVPDVLGMIGGVLDSVRSLLPFSDAEQGPLADLSDSGGALVRTLAGGVAGEQDELLGVVGEAAESIRAHLPFSDAKTGPLADVSSSGSAFVRTFAEGAAGEQSTLDRTVSSVLPTPQPAGSAAGKTSAPAGRSGPASVSLTLDQSVDVQAGEVDPDRMEQIARDATRDGGHAALRELEQRLKEATNP